MYHEPRIIPAGYIRSSRFDVADVEFYVSRFLGRVFEQVENDRSFRGYLYIISECRVMLGTMVKKGTYNNESYDL